jgi:nicotinamide-nucleotide amidase
MAEDFDQVWRDLAASAKRLIERCAAQGLMLATAESCTGGLVAAFLTEIAGSSAVVDRAFVTYSNAAKTDMLGVPASLIAAYGAVSAEVATAMATGALAKAGADLAVAVTGIAGPGGGSVEKPVGLVHFALAGHGAPVQRMQRRFGPIGRQAIRFAAVAQAFDLIAMSLG